MPYWAALILGAVIGLGFLLGVNALERRVGAIATFAPLAIATILGCMVALARRRWAAALLAASMAGMMALEATGNGIIDGAEWILVGLLVAALWLGQRQSRRGAASVTATEPAVDRADKAI